MNFAVIKQAGRIRGVLNAIRQAGGRVMDTRYLSTGVHPDGSFMGSALREGRKLLNHSRGVTNYQRPGLVQTLANKADDFARGPVGQHVDRTAMALTGVSPVIAGLGGAYGVASLLSKFATTTPMKHTDHLYIVKLANEQNTLQKILDYLTDGGASAPGMTLVGAGIGGLGGAAAGGTVGAIGGALGAEEGDRMQSALRGGRRGAVIGGGLGATLGGFGGYAGHKGWERAAEQNGSQWERVKQRSLEGGTGAGGILGAGAGGVAGITAGWKIKNPKLRALVTIMSGLSGAAGGAALGRRQSEADVAEMYRKILEAGYPMPRE